jgi:hypothetical protein
MGEEVLIRRMLRRTDVANMDDLVWGCVLMQIVADKDPLINDTLKNHPFYKWAFSWTHGLLAVIQRAYENTLNPHLHIQTQEDIQILWEDLGGGTRFFPFPASTQRQQLQLDMGPHGNVCEMMNKVIRVMDEPWYNKAFLDKPLSHPSWNESSVNKTQKAHNKTPDDDKTLTQLNPVVQPPQVQLPQVQPPQVQLPQSESKSSVVTPVDSSATPSSAREANAKESIITVLNSQTETSKNQKKEPMIKDGEISELAGEEKVRSYPAYLIIKELTAKERVVVLKLSCPKKVTTR